MSDYTKTTDFDVKDSLPSGDTGKIIRGSEFEVEFENIEVAIASKADSLNTVLTGNTSATNLSVTGNTTLGNAATDTVTISGDVAVDTNTLFVDVSEDRVGINTSSPATALDVNGTVTANGLTVDGATELSGLFSIEGSQPSIILKETDTTDVNTFLANSSGDFSIRTVTEAGAATIRFNLDHATGDISFYEDTGTTPKLFWDASAEKLVVGGDDTSATSSVFSSLILGEYTKTTTGITLRASSGSAINFENSDTGVDAAIYYNHAANFMVISTASSEAIRINSSGNVGIGTLAPSSKLQVSDGATDNVSMDVSGVVSTLKLGSVTTGAGNFVVSYDRATGRLATSLGPKGSENDAFSIASDGDVSFDGRVGIGTDNPAAPFHVSSTVSSVNRFVSDNVNGTNLGVANTGEGIAQFLLDASDGNFSGSDYVRFRQNNDLSAELGTLGAHPLLFVTGQTERVRIDSSGNLLVGATAVVSDSVHGAQVASTGLISTSRDGTGTLGHHLFYNTNGLVGSISTNGTATAYNTSSDVRLKENITDAPEGNVDALQVRSFDWKVDGSHQEYGFIAQELEAVAPYAVTKGETEEDMWGVDYSKLVPMLVKEIQDLKARIATLEAN